MIRLRFNDFLHYTSMREDRQEKTYGERERAAIQKFDKIYKRFLGLRRNKGRKRLVIFLEVW